MRVPDGGDLPPTVVAPMLASAGVLPTGPGWAYEFKWDRVRAVVHVDETVSVQWRHPREGGGRGGPCGYHRSSTTAHEPQPPRRRTGWKGWSRNVSTPRTGRDAVPATGPRCRSATPRRSSSSATSQAKADAPARSARC